MKTLSVIIVNYNVRNFLEQSLHAVIKSLEGIESEIFVVDNNSVDGSGEMVKEKFPEVQLIRNESNLGFSKANNQAIRKAEGKYILLLNPDTVVETDTFTKTIKFMDEHSEAGGLGVMMLDGKGNYLPESKRGLPTPWVAFYKIFGLNYLFPKSRIFGKYHLGYLDKNKINQVDILSGAFMLLRKDVLDKTGLLDENFFMYGEDIDLSYRITKAGYKLYYFPETRIIHYKGESTKKTSINYVLVFYNAMIIFAKKHFSNTNLLAFSSLIKTTIYIRASTAIFFRFISLLFLPLADGTSIYIGMFLTKRYWEVNHKYIEGGHYPAEFMLIAVPFYIIFWIGTVYFSDGYEKNFKFSNLFKGIIIGTFIISALTNFFDPFRFSKALILLGATWAIFTMIALRVLIHFIKFKDLSFDSRRLSRVIIVGDEFETTRVFNLLMNSSSSVQCLGFVSVSEDQNNTKNFWLGNIKNLHEITEVYKVEEIIFCSKDISSNSIMDWMLRMDKAKLNYRIVPDESNYIIGSGLSGRQSELYSVNIELAISKIKNQRNKRILDIGSSVIFLLFSPLLVWFTTNPLQFLKNCFFVFAGKLSWVGFSQIIAHEFPEIKNGVLSPMDAVRNKKINYDTTRRINNFYAKDYSLEKDFSLIFTCFTCLGRTFIKK